MAMKPDLDKDLASATRQLILVVDDQPDNLLIIEDALESRYSVVTAASGEVALQIVLAQHPDLILLDQQMPVMDGLTVLSRLKADDRTANIPVIFVTSADDIACEEAGLAAGAVDYITKPVNDRILLARVSTHLELAKTRQSLVDANNLLESRVRERTEQLAKSNRVKDEFLAIMSHELRTPLNGILGMADLMQMTIDDPEQREYIETLKDSGNHLSRLVNRILAYVQLESGKTTPAQSPFNLEETVEQAIKTCMGSANQKNLELKLILAPAVRRIANGDSSMLRSVLIELVENAIAFTKQGSITVIAESEKSADQQDALIHFAVQDTGCGIAEEAIARLFHPFHQVDGSATRSHGGIGLGLALSQRRVALLGGNIWVESTPGHGSTFHFTVAN